MESLTPLEDYFPGTRAGTGHDRGMRRAKWGPIDRFVGREGRCAGTTTAFHAARSDHHADETYMVDLAGNKRRRPRRVTARERYNKEARVTIPDDQTTRTDITDMEVDTARSSSSGDDDDEQNSSAPSGAVDWQAAMTRYNECVKRGLVGRSVAGMAPPRKLF